MIGLPAAPTAVGAVTGNASDRALERSCAKRVGHHPLLGDAVHRRDGPDGAHVRPIGHNANDHRIDERPGLHVQDCGRELPRRRPEVESVGRDPLGVPGAPTAVHAVAGAAKHSARVHWTAPTNNGAAITAYVVTPYIGAEAQPARAFHNSSTTEIFAGLQQGRDYRFRVAAVNRSWDGSTVGWVQPDARHVAKVDTQPMTRRGYGQLDGSRAPTRRRGARARRRAGRRGRRATGRPARSSPARTTTASATDDPTAHAEMLALRAAARATPERGGSTTTRWS